MTAGQNVVAVLKWMAKRKDHPLTIVECGTIRNPSFNGHEDGIGTYEIAKWIAESGVKHEFYSFELIAGTLKASKEFLRANGGLDQYVTFALGDATLLLEHFCLPIDFCYLDAGADPFQNLAQYRYAKKWLRKPGAIMIDDVFDPRNADRGLVTVPYAKLEGDVVLTVANRQALIPMGFQPEDLTSLFYGERR